MVAPARAALDRHRQGGYVLLFPGAPLELGRTLEMNDHRVTIVGISNASAPFASLPVMHARYSEAIDFLGRVRTQLSFIVGATRSASRTHASTPGSGASST